MTVEMLKGKIHRATVVQAELHYVGSITVDQALLEAAGILEYEKVQIVDIDNGSRFETYTIAGERGSGMICLNGAAARCVSVGDKIIIMSYAHMTPEEVARGYHPNVVFVDEENQVARVTAYEKHGLLKDMPEPFPLWGREEGCVGMPARLEREIHGKSARKVRPAVCVRRALPPIKCPTWPAPCGKRGRRSMW